MMINELFILAIIALVDALLVVSFAFWLGHGLRRYDIIDTFWGILFIVIALAGYMWSDKVLLQALVMALVLLWGVRLATHIGGRFRASKNEDPRYVELRKKWRGSIAINAFFRIYVTQAVLATIISLPVLAVMAYAELANSPIIWLGFVVWAFGFACQVVADRQLKEFLTKEKNQGKLMQSGLWKYSRHPNYFGELSMWWGVFAISCASTGVAWMIIGPVTITYLILKVSGIPPSEKRMAEKPGWKAYKARTSVLIPLPNRKIG
jgi:steroid 5-alpha reductase family enzyme